MKQSKNSLFGQTLNLFFWFSKWNRWKSNFENSLLKSKISNFFCLNKRNYFQRWTNFFRFIDFRDQQIKIIFKNCKTNVKYKDNFLFRVDIKNFFKKINEIKQFINRIHDFVQNARNHREINIEIIDVFFVFQVRNRFLTTMLFFRCDYVIFFDYVIHDDETIFEKNFRNFRFNFVFNRKNCENLIQKFRFRQQFTHEIENILYWIRFVVLERDRSINFFDENMIVFVDRVHDQIQFARYICNVHFDQIVDMLAKMFETKKMFRDATFYASMTNAKKTIVYAIMAQSFQNTRHWYCCVNEHFFTMSECDMSMKTIKCSQCEIVVNEIHHEFAMRMTRTINMKTKFEKQKR